MNTKKFVLLGLLAGLGATVAINAARADTLQDIKTKGVLVVGVKADYPPFGSLSPSGENIGIEPDLARDLAKGLGVKVQFVPVVASNRMQFLEQGKIDVMIATMNDTPERAKVIDIVHPDYYASGYNIMVPKTLNLTNWNQLKGVPVCAIQGAFYNKEVAEKFGAETVAFTGVAEALTALRQGRCNAFVYDDTAIEGKLQDPAWKDYDMPLQSQDAQPWGIAVRLGDTNLADYISKSIIGWDKTGLILSLETKYGIKHAAFAVQMHNKYK
ncbi:MAG: transporter substrate-binding domain-containing protein [Acidocella sp.]|nr:transporter substrate-binding domain-containing protein [Acidocella sp.]